MNRKKWTAKTEITDDLLKFREKRKWQLALRRYVLEKKPSPQYAPYFGVDIETFRKWIEAQFTPELNWDNFASSWQFYHLLPTTYFDFSDETELKLCWNFINIRVERIDPDKQEEDRIDILTLKTHFKALYEETGFAPAIQMAEKIEGLERIIPKQQGLISGFINQHKESLDQMASLSPDEFTTLNLGTPLSDIMLERAILQKFGG